jgi:hypothetical protein
MRVYFLPSIPILLIKEVISQMSDSSVLTKWSELKALVEALELDVAKNAKGVAAAGVRTRKGLRQLQANARELVKLTLETDKTGKADKVEKKPKKG